ncbi:hypothetical protein O181_017928 [Austropuccinia psidii MF-1]|uniref:Integrase catalytic domain-containing protein n=1 Tax=Austropuccinia psidii MF-1 TaxID=1389203 RepID=A0A9Q3C823_9BASI|nr:hypothetical protein [Austropuccinia psidii MF-1]
MHRWQLMGQNNTPPLSSTMCLSRQNSLPSRAAHIHPIRTSRLRQQADCPVTKGFVNPNPRPSSPAHWRTPRPATPERRPPPPASSLYQRERVSQVKFVEHDATDRVLIDTGASIHLSGSLHFATTLRDISPFQIFFADSNSSILISRTRTLKIPVKRGYVVVHDVAFLAKILGGYAGRVLSLFFENLLLSLLVSTTFRNDCWWMDIVPGGETKVLAAASSPPVCLEMNPISFPDSKTLSPREWHKCLGHVSDRVVVSFLEQHVPSFNTKHWQTFDCNVCAKSKSIHQLAKPRTNIPTSKPLDLLVSDVMGPFTKDAQGFRVQTKIAPKALRTDNTQEFTSASFVKSLAKLGVSFCPSLPYSPQENGEAERLNRTLGDMARAMLTQSGIPTRFWQFSYASACFIHNRIPNSRCLNSSPYQELHGQPPSILVVYPFGVETLVHIQAVHQRHKLDSREIECKLVKPLLSGGWLLWEPSTNKMVQSASVIFPQFQPANTAQESSNKGSLRHIVSTVLLGEVPTEKYFESENQAIDLILMAKDVNIPTHLGKALSGAYQENWKAACQAELDQMATRDVWEVLPKLPGMKTIGHCWVFDLKCNLDGTVEEFKARLVARGDRQRPGIDCAKTYTPTASLMSLRPLMGTAVLKGWQVASFNVSGAYLYSPVKECILMEPLVDFLPALWGKVLHLKKALYGMRQAGRNALCSELNIKWSEKLTQIVGLECVISKGEVVMTQKRLTEGILEAYPQQLIRRDAPLPVLPVGGMTPTAKALDPTPFRSVIGLLAYLVSGTRPDLAFAVNYLARHSTAPTTEHWELLDHVLGEAPILWALKRQSVVALSTCTVEYVALSDSTQHFVQAINQLTHLTGHFDKLIFCDNQAAVQVAFDKKSRKRMRYLDRAFFFVNNTIQKHSIKVTWVKTANMQAEALRTNNLAIPPFPGC